VPRVLGIETSCDETSAAVVETDAQGHARIASLVILSQDVHGIFGGVVPELASRQHLTAIDPVVQRALADAGGTLADLDAIGVTHAPGLVGALLVGVSYAKGLALSTGLPLVAVHHLEGHLFAQSLEEADAEPPFTALLVSGGHTLLLDVPAWGAYRLLGRTRDDAAGEAFDKVAKLLGLGYPGGAALERLARGGDAARFPFTPPMLHGGQRAGDPDYYDVSFSGLKTALRRAVQEAGDALDDSTRADLARGFQDALVRTLVEKTARAAQAHGRRRIVLGGGVACNTALRDAMRARAARFGAVVHAPTPRLATDNAAMIARAALFRWAAGDRAPLDLNAQASLPLPGLAA
jgi:N6-L-threonylcarbamoyladenine synthase